jgi:hypothetical protein
MAIDACCIREAQCHRRFSMPTPGMVSRVGSLARQLAPNAASRSRISGRSSPVHSTTSALKLVEIADIMEPAIHSRMRLIAEASQHWDGVNPIREISTLGQTP